jgi:hypothetical protein
MERRISARTFCICLTVFDEEEVEAAKTAAMYIADSFARPE